MGNTLVSIPCEVSFDPHVKPITAGWGAKRLSLPKSWSRCRSEHLAAWTPKWPLFFCLRTPFLWVKSRKNGFWGVEVVEGVFLWSRRGQLRSPSQDNYRPDGNRTEESSEVPSAHEVTVGASFGADRELRFRHLQRLGRLEGKGPTGFASNDLDFFQDPGKAGLWPNFH